MIFKEEISTEKACELFDDERKVYEFIASVKWKEGFVCRKCSNTNFCEGKKPYSRRCTRCKTEESATAHTIFHNLKFPVNKAFYIAYNVCVLGSDFSSYNYADQLEINQMTCWKFRKRILTCLNNIQDNENKTIRTVLMSSYK